MEDFEGKIKVHPVNFEGEQKHKAKTYSKGELKDLYGICKNTLNYWIQRDIEQFKKLGYSKYQKKLNPLQVKLCYELWGEPD